MIRQKILLTLAGTLTGSTTSPVIDMTSKSLGMFLAPTGATAATFYVAQSGTDAAPAQLYNSSNAAVSRTLTAGKWYPIPDECFGTGFLVIVFANASVTSMTLWLAA